MLKKHKFYFVLIFAAILTGCTTAPKLTKNELFDQYPQIASLVKGLKDAKAQGVDNLAPSGYETAKTRMSEALASAESNRKEAATRESAQGLQILQKANADAATSRELFSEVLDARDKAYQAGADKINRQQVTELDKKFRRAASLVEQGRMEGAKQQRHKLVNAYSQLELATLKEGVVDAARASLAQSEKEGAAKHASRTYQQAQEELALAVSILDSDRTQTERANVHAKRAKWLAERSSAVTELIKDFERRDYTLEDVVLWYQNQLSEVNTPLGGELPFNEPNRNVVLSMQRSINEILKQREETATAESRYKQELSEYQKKASLSSAERSALRRVESMFAEFEANVYQKNKDVLISVHGFSFPPGKSNIETENFALLNKIVQAINTFPNSRITVSGHTDALGNDSVNMTLSETRAGNVAKFLTEVGGVSNERIVAYGYGEDRPVANNETAEGRAANRRVDIMIHNE